MRHYKSSNNIIQGNCLWCNILISIQYRCAGIGDGGLAAISRGCKKLKMLNLSYCDGVTDRGMEYLSSLEELSSLEMRALRNITATGLTKLAAGCRRLAELDLKNCEEIDDSGFWALAYYCSNLQQVLTLGKLLNLW